MYKDKEDYEKRLEEIEASEFDKMVEEEFNKMGFGHSKDEID